MSTHGSPRVVEHHDAVMRRQLRICVWLGLAPGSILEIVDGAPDEHGQIELTWRSMLPEVPHRGKVTATGARGDWGQPTVHSGVLYLDPSSAASMLEIAGPKPSLLGDLENSPLAADWKKAQAFNTLA